MIYIMMQRTQIYFPEELHKDLKIGAKVMNVSLSKYIRIILKKNLYAKYEDKDVSPKKKADLSIIAKNAIDLGPPDLARNFDDYFEASLR